MSNISASSIRGKAIQEKDIFVDETPKQFLRYLLKVSNHSMPFEFNYTVSLDGDAKENGEKLETIRIQAQVDMEGLLRRLQASDDSCEFQAWRCIDRNGIILEQSDILSVYVKPRIQGS